MVHSKVRLIPIYTLYSVIINIWYHVWRRIVCRSASSNSYARRVNGDVPISFLRIMIARGDIGVDATISRIIENIRQHAGYCEEVSSRSSVKLTSIIDTTRYSPPAVINYNYVGGILTYPQCARGFAAKISYISCLQVHQCQQVKWSPRPRNGQIDRSFQYFFIINNFQNIA